MDAFFSKLTKRLAKANNADRSFAMKIYRKKNAEFYFTTEARNFALLTLYSHEPSPGLIGFFGGFEHNGEYHILLEYADCGTLENYFETEEPPATGADILAFWNSFKEIIKAIVKIHEIKRDDKDQLGMQVFQGCVSRSKAFACITFAISIRLYESLH